MLGQITIAGVAIHKHQMHRLDSVCDVHAFVFVCGFVVEVKYALYLFFSHYDSFVVTGSSVPLFIHVVLTH